MNALLAIFLFGVLVFIHELGHFLVAKYAGVYVEKFAIGFGPAIFRKQYGETEYALCLLPLGGYVKMRGEEMEAIQGAEEVPFEKDDARSYANQGVWTRIAIASMGPIFNFILAIVVFTSFYLVGVQTPKSVLGYVQPGSPAQTAGLQAGDEVVSINKKPIKTWQKMVSMIKKNKDSALNLSVIRSGEQQNITVTSKTESGLNPYGETVESGSIGVELYSRKPVIGVFDSNKIGTLDIKTGDEIVSINGNKIQYWWQFENALKNNTNGMSAVLSRRLGDAKELTLNIPAGVEKPSDLGVEFGDLYLLNVVKDSPAEKKGLKAGDKIIAINGTRIINWEAFRKIVQSAKDKELSIDHLRNGEKLNTSITPKEYEETDALTSNTQKTPKLGVVSASLFGQALMFKDQTLNPFKAVYRGALETAEMSYMTVKGLLKLFMGKLPMKAVGGPISIYYLAGNSYQAGGWTAFFRMMAMLSITLAVINLFPIPMLDGGHIFMFLIEAIRGKALPEKVIMFAQQVGMVLLLGMMVTVFYVDINRFFVGKIIAFFKG